MRYGLERHNETLLRLHARWQRLMDSSAGAPAGNDGVRDSRLAFVPPAAASTPYAPTDAPASGRATGDAAGNDQRGMADAGGSGCPTSPKHGAKPDAANPTLNRTVDTERDGR